MRNSTSVSPPADDEYPPSCDRCNRQTRYSHLIGFPLNDCTYWLCADCEEAVVREWLVQYELQIHELRQNRIHACQSDE